MADSAPHSMMGTQQNRTAATSSAAATSTIATVAATGGRRSIPMTGRVRRRATSGLICMISLQLQPNRT